MARRRWPEETKVRAMADMAAGATVADVARRYGVPVGTIAHWSPSSKRGSTKLSKIANLQDLEDTFREHAALNFAAQKAILELFTDAEWLHHQSAADVIAAYTAFFAKSGKLLGALYGPAAQRLDDDLPDAENTP